MTTSNQDHTQKLRAPPDFRGPIEKRRCTDVLCTLFIFVTWLVMSYFGMQAIQLGDYRVVLYPMDYNGNICGTDYGNVDMTDFKYLYPVNFYSGGVCVKECPIVKYPHVDLFTLITYSGLYKPQLPINDIDNTENLNPLANNLEIADYTNSSSYVNTTCNIDKCFPMYNPVTSWSSAGINKGSGYAFYVVDSKPYMNRCIVSEDALGFLYDFTNSDEEIRATGSSKNKRQNGWLSSVTSDVYFTRNYILGFGLAFSVVMGFAYSLLLQLPGFLVIMVWGSLFATIAMIGGIGYYVHNESLAWRTEEPQLHSDSQIIALKTISYTLWGLGLVLFCLMCALRKRISLAIGIVKESARAIGSMPVLILFPILQSACLFAFVIIWMIYAIHLASLGKMQTNAVDINGMIVNIRDFEYDRVIEYQGWFLLFCFFWTSQFIIALGEIILALSASKWFFTHDKSLVGNKTVFHSIYQGLIYHAGTAAFGSLVLAVISMIRSFLTYVQRKAKKTGNKFVVAIMACLQCFMYCLEKCMKFLNKNAYIQTAIFGTSFCTSAKEAFFLILRNAARVGALSTVSEIVVFIGKIFISIITGGVSYLLIDQNLGEEINSPIAPVIVVVLLSYFSGSMFMNVFSMVTSTLLQCFIADEEMFNGSDESYSSQTLTSCTESHDETSSEIGN